MRIAILKGGADANEAVMTMQVIQWGVAAVTAVFVAAVAFLQWRTAQQKAALDLFERRHAIYEIVRNAVGTMATSPVGFDGAREAEFMQMMERAFFFFGDDVNSCIQSVWSDIQNVIAADAELKGLLDNKTRGELIHKRRAALNRIALFHNTGRPIFARYMRFSQTVQ